MAAQYFARIARLLPLTNGSATIVHVAAELWVFPQVYRKKKAGLEIAHEPTGFVTLSLYRSNALPGLFKIPSCYVAIEFAFDGVHHGDLKPIYNRLSEPITGVRS